MTSASPSVLSLGPIPGPESPRGVFEALKRVDFSGVFLGDTTTCFERVELALGVIFCGLLTDFSGVGENGKGGRRDATRV